MDTKAHTPLKLQRMKRSGKCDLTPFTLFEQVPSVQEENMTYIEYLMGLLYQLNQLITLYNTLAGIMEKFDEQIGDLPDRMTALEQDMQNFQLTINGQIGNILNQITEGDINTLAAAKKYTDDEIAKIGGGGAGSGGVMYGALTAAEYDSLNLAAVDYDDYQWTAFEYDTRAKWILFGEDGSIYMQFKETVTVNALETIFDLANPPVKLGKRYAVEISLGNFSLDGNEPAKLEIVGTNTMGNTMPITVPNGGSSTVAVIWNDIPTAVRLMSGEEQITAYNAFIKIKPLGER